MHWDGGNWEPKDNIGGGSKEFLNHRKEERCIMRSNTYTHTHRHHILYWPGGTSTNFADKETIFLCGQCLP